jgi:hypothetical protein
MQNQWFSPSALEAEVTRHLADYMHFERKSIDDGLST